MPGPHPGERRFESGPRNQRRMVRLMLLHFSGKEGNIEAVTTTTGMAAVIAAMSTVTELMGSVWDLLTSNPLLTLFVAAGLLPVGIRIFVKLRNAARG